MSDRRQKRFFCESPRVVCWIQNGERDTLYIYACAYNWAQMLAQCLKLQFKQCYNAMLIRILETKVNYVKLSATLIIYTFFLVYTPLFSNILRYLHNFNHSASHGRMWRPSLNSYKMTMSWYKFPVSKFSWWQNVIVTTCGILMKNAKMQCTMVFGSFFSLIPRVVRCNLLNCTLHSQKTKWY